MSPLVVIFSILLSAYVYADVSHLTGYQYPKQAYNLGTASLKLHTADSPATTQYSESYGNGQPLPSSYSPPPSGSPFDSTAPLPKTYSMLSHSLASSAPTVQARSYQHDQYQQYAPQVQYRQTAPQTQYQQTVQQTQYVQPSLYQAPPVQYQSAAQTQEPLITKHFYVHAAPEEPEEETSPRFVSVGRAQKHYKIIFIKTPTYSLKNQIVPVLPQNEEKTIVYVLSKKPSFEQSVQLPTPQPTEPSKPEVFFVKYKTQEEAERAQKEIQDAYNQANGDQSAIDVRFSSSDTEPTTSFGGQETFQQNQNQYGGYYSSAQHNNRKRRFIA